MTGGVGEAVKWLLLGEKPKLQEDGRAWTETVPGALWKSREEGIPHSPQVRGLERSEDWKVMFPSKLE